jgi:hypothetical protein
MGADRLVAVQAGLLNRRVDELAFKEFPVARRAFHLGHGLGVLGKDKTIRREQDNNCEEQVISAHHDEKL